ncbi:alpha/beta hydrolase family protein [Microbacterium enclense]|uniref:alpha/beta hydrolase family protein n=1 Tax=Microbacterium enclense TaxID=993073 RepID=UPI003F7E1DC7
MIGVLSVGGILIISASVLTGLGAVLGRMLVQWKFPILSTVHSISADTAVLDSTPLTRYAGHYGLRTTGGHARIGEVLADENGRVTRAVLSVRGNILSARRAAYDGDLHSGPEEICAHEDVNVHTELGPAPAWQFGSGEAETWIVHVHGFQANRNNVLRSVEAMLGIRATQLVVSYRGDGEGPDVKGGATTLGLDEWRDVDAALSYAADRGAKRIVMVGWSMGAAISLLIGERSTHRSLIVGQVLVSPATDWIATMQTSAQRMGIPFPQTLGQYAAWYLHNRVLCRLTGLTRPIDFDVLNWTTPGRVHSPTLVIHSDGDLTIPIAATRRFADANRGHVTLHETTRAAHTWEFNVDREAASRTARAWVEALLDKAAQ